MKQHYLRNKLCIPVRGFNRSILYDLLRSDYHFISNELYEVLKVDDVIHFDNYSQGNVIKEWREFLLKEEVLIELESQEERLLFPNLDMTFYTPFLITDVIIHQNLKWKCLKKFQNIDIRNISILIDDYNMEKILILLREIQDLEVDSICLFFTENGLKLDSDDFNEIAQINQLLYVYLFNSKYASRNNTTLLNVIMLPYSFKEYSKNVFPEKLTINIDQFLESFNYHSYFHKKIYIDYFGNIKNGYSSTKNFNNLNFISRIGFIELLKSDHFQGLWNIKKDETLICDNCEFRFMCVDPRVPKQNKNGKWYHDEECNYNPYISKWSNEENYKTLAESGVTIDQNGEIKIDNEILSEVFETIWGK